MIYMNALNAGRTDADHYDAENIMDYPDDWAIDDTTMSNFQNAKTNLNIIGSFLCLHSYGRGYVGLYRCYSVLQVRRQVLLCFIFWVVRLLPWHCFWSFLPIPGRREKIIFIDVSVSVIWDGNGR